MNMAATLRVCLIILLCAALQYNPLASQQSDSAWTLLNTLDVQGNISTISPDSQYVNVITEAEIAQLVRIETGEVIAENAGGSIFLFSPSGRYASYFDYGFVEMETTLLDLQTGISRAVDGYIDRYIDNERYVAVTYRTVDLKDLNSLIDLQTGEIVAEFEGSTTFSSNGRFAAVTDLESRPHIPTKIIEIATGNVIAEFNYDYISTEGMWSAYTRFHANSRYLSIFYFPEEIHIIDTATWQMLYSVQSIYGIGFSRDGRYAISLNDDGYSDVELMDAATGQVLDTVLGTYSFSADSRYLLRNEAVTYDLRHLKIINLSTNNTVFEYEGMIGEYVLVTDKLLQIYNRETQSTLYFDITTGDLAQEVEGWAEFRHNMLIIEDFQTDLLTLRTWEDPTPIVQIRQIEIAPDGSYALASNGEFVEVYGPANS